MASPLPLVIDTDVGADPDDALALLLALASPEVDLRGVAIVSGDVGWRGRIASQLLGMAGRPDIPIFLGQGDPRQMSGAEGAGLLDHPYDGPTATIQPTPAVDWLLAESHRRPFHLVAIGPLTNVAAAIEQDPGFARRLLSLTVMGGLLDAQTMPAAWQRAIRERGGAGWPDYNTTSDPEAALTVAQSGIPTTWVPLDVTMRAPLRAATRNALPPDHPLGAALGRMIDAWHAAWFPAALPATDDPSPVPPDAVAILHDPLAVAALFPGDWLRLHPARLDAAIDDGVFRLHERSGGSPGQLAADVDGERFSAFLLARLRGLIRSAAPPPSPATPSSSRSRARTTTRPGSGSSSSPRRRTWRSGPSARPKSPARCCRRAGRSWKTPTSLRSTRSWKGSPSKWNAASPAAPQPALRRGRGRPQRQSGAPSTAKSTPPPPWTKPPWKAKTF